MTDTVVARDFDQLGLTVGDWVHIGPARPPWWRPIKLLRWWLRRRRNPEPYEGTYKVTSVTATSIGIEP